MGLPCLSCKKDTAPDRAKVFAEVFLCPDCYLIAERLYRRGESELRMMLLVLKESIRLAALKGELQFNFGQLEDIPKEDLLSHLAKLAGEAREQAVPRSKEPWTNKTPDKTPLLGPTSPSVPSADGDPTTS